MRSIRPRRCAETSSSGWSRSGCPRDEVERRIDWAAKLLRIEPLLDRKPSQLSGGQRQRVAIGRALVKKVGVFLFDEPLSNLDAKLRTEMRLEIKKLHNELKQTVVYVTHDQIEAMTMATRIAIMDRGVIQQIGSPDDVYETPANLFVAKFIGSPPMNILNGVLKVSGDSVTALHEPTNTAIDLSAYPFLTRPADGTKVAIGLRPEHFSLGEGGSAGVTASFSLPLLYTEKTGSDATAFLTAGGRGDGCAHRSVASGRPHHRQAGERELPQAQNECLRRPDRAEDVGQKAKQGRE